DWSSDVCSSDLTRCLVRNEEESVSPRHSSGCWSAPGLRRKSPRLLTHCAAGRRGHRKACPMATRSCKNGCAPYVLTPQLVVNSRLSWMPRAVPEVVLPGLNTRVLGCWHRLPSPHSL